MRGVAASVLCSLVALSIAACTSMQGRAMEDEAAVRKLEVRPGDAIRLLTKYRQRYTIVVTSVGPATLKGETVRLSSKETQAEHVPVEVAYADIALIDARRPNFRRTAVTGLLVVEVVGLVVLAVEGVPPGMPGP